MSTISFIIPTIGRESLTDTILSIEHWDYDEIIVVPDVPASGSWGNDQRNEGIARAKGDYLAFIDDDDVYLPGHRVKMEMAIENYPGKAFLFQMVYPNDDVLWMTKQVIPGNIGSPMILCPNTPEFVTPWKEGRNMADFIFVDQWPKHKIKWQKEIIVQLGHNDGETE